jgi:hypothetical protein
MHISRMADMPVDVAMAASVPSSAARRNSMLVTVGLPEPAVGVALLLAAKAARRCGGVGLDIAAGEEQGFGVFAVLAARGSGMDGQGIDVQWGGEQSSWFGMVG